MSTVSLAESGSCAALNHHYHYIQYPCVGVLGGGGARVSGYYEQPPVAGRLTGPGHGEDETPPGAPTYCNCRCSCGGGGGVEAVTAAQPPTANPRRHAPQSSIDSQMAVAVTVHRQAGSGNNNNTDKSQSEQSLLHHSYQRLQQPPSATGEEKPLNALSAGGNHGGVDALNIRCGCECPPDGACACAAPRETKTAARLATADAMLGVDEITVSESDNNSGTLVKKKRVRGSERSAKKFNSSWCATEAQPQAGALPPKRCLCLSRESPYGVYSDGDVEDDDDDEDNHLDGRVPGGGGGDDAADGGGVGRGTRTDARPPLPPRPPPTTRPRSVNAAASAAHHHHHRLHGRSGGALSSAGVGGHHGSGPGGSGGPAMGGIKKYVVWCLICGGFSCLLGVLFLGVYFLLHSYTITVGNFETVPTFVPASLLILTGLCVMSLARRRNRYSYLIKLSGACGLISALTCALVTVTTTVLHMSRLQALRECEYAQITRTCTCYSDKEGIRLVFDSLADCGVVHGSLYSCLRAIFGLSVAGVLVAVFSCMLVYQLLSHERKKMYWEQLELRCRSLYTSSQQGPPPASIAALTAAAAAAAGPHPGAICRCCEQCHAHRQAAVAAAAAAAYAWEEGGEPRFWTGQPPGNFYSPNPGSEEQQHHFALAMAAGLAGGGGGRCRNAMLGGGGGGVGSATSAAGGTTGGASAAGGSGGGGHRGRSSGWAWPRSWPWQRSSPEPTTATSSGGGGGGGGAAPRYRHAAHTPSSPDSQYGFSNAAALQPDSLTVAAGGAAAPSSADGLALGMLTGGDPSAPSPYSMLAHGGGGGAALPYGVWGPPPPYSDPNSPARRGYYQYVQPPSNGGGGGPLPPTATVAISMMCTGLADMPGVVAGNNDPSQAALQQQQQQQLQQPPPCLNHRSVFLDTPPPPPSAQSTTAHSGSACCGAGDASATQRCCAAASPSIAAAHNGRHGSKRQLAHVAAAAAQPLKNKDYGGGGGGEYANTPSDTSDGDGLYDGHYAAHHHHHHYNGGGGGGGECANTLPTRKLKKRLEAAGGGAKSIGPNSAHAHAVGERRNVQQLFAAAGAPGQGGGGGVDGDAAQRPNRPGTLAGLAEGNAAFKPSNGNNNGDGRVDDSGSAKDPTEAALALDPAESEVYFADVSSCCNVSVKNDNNYYETATTTATTPAAATAAPHALPRHQHQGSAYSQSSSCGEAPAHAGTNNNNNSSNANEDYLAARLGQRGNSKRSRLPFPAAATAPATAVGPGLGEDHAHHHHQHNNNNNGAYLPKDTSRQSMCSADSAEEPKTDFTDLSPATPATPLANNTTNPHVADDFVVAAFAAYTSEAQCLEAHRRSTKNIHEMMLQSEAHYEVITDQHQHHHHHQQPQPQHQHITPSRLAGNLLRPAVGVPKRHDEKAKLNSEHIMAGGKEGSKEMAPSTGKPWLERIIVGGGSATDGERLVRL